MASCLKASPLKTEYESTDQFKLSSQAIDLK